MIIWKRPKINEKEAGMALLKNKVKRAKQYRTCFSSSGQSSPPATEALLPQAVCKLRGALLRHVSPGPVVFYPKSCNCCTWTAGQVADRLPAVCSSASCSSARWAFSRFPPPANSWTKNVLLRLTKLTLNWGLWNVNKGLLIVKNV